MWRIARKIQIIKQYPYTIAELDKSSDKETEAQQVKWYYKHTVRLCRPPNQTTWPKL